jgi:hypothetical protein
MPRKPREIAGGDVAVEFGLDGVLHGALQPLDGRLGQPVACLAFQGHLDVAPHRVTIGLVGDQGALEGELHPAGLRVVREAEGADTVGQVVGVAGAMARHGALHPGQPPTEGGRRVEGHVEPRHAPQWRALERDRNRGDVVGHGGPGAGVEKAV